MKRGPSVGQYSYWYDGPVYETRRLGAYFAFGWEVNHLIHPSYSRKASIALMLLAISRRLPGLLKYLALYEATSGQFRNTWAAVSSASMQALHSGLSVTPMTKRCLLKDPWPVMAAVIIHNYCLDSRRFCLVKRLSITRSASLVCLDLLSSVYSFSLYSWTIIDWCYYTFRLFFNFPLG